MSQTRDTKGAPDAAIRSWYKTKRWQELRIAVLTRDLFVCQKTGVILTGKANVSAQTKMLELVGAAAASEAC